MKCPRCGAAIPANAPEGFCWLCLAREGAASRRRNAGPAAPIPEKFGDYKILGEVARGGMGIVYRAHQISLNRPVALKMILAGQLATPESVARFELEAKAAAKLDHPHIVPIYEVGEHEAQRYFTMKFVEGGTLGERISDFKLRISDSRAAVRERAQRIAALMKKVADALAYAHAHGILHRDLKPSNILLDTDDEPLLTDFGLAKFTGEESGLTLTHASLGTPAYMSPEQAAGCVKEITTAADVYGLGAVLFELLTGRAPFSGETPMAVARKVIEEDPPSPATLNPAVPQDLAVICLKCLAKAPADRYASAAALAEDLGRFSRGELVSAVRLTPIQAAWRWARRRPQIAALIGLCTASLVAGIIGIAWQWRKTELARRGESLALRHATETVVDLYTRSGINAAKGGEPTRAALWFAKAATATPDPARRAEELGRQMAWRMGAYTCVRAFESGIGQVGELRWNAAQTAIAALARYGRRSAVWEVVDEKRWQPQEWESMEFATWANQASWIAYASGDWVLVVEFPSAREIARADAGGTVNCLAVSHDDRWIAVGTGEPFLWDIVSGKRMPLPTGLGALTGLEFSRNGRYLLLTGGTNRAVCALAVPGEFLTPPVEAHALGAVGFLGHGENFLTTTRNGKLLVIETATGQTLESYRTSTATNESVRAVSPDGRSIARYSLPLILRSVGQTNFPTHKNRFEAVDFSRDGKWLLTGGYDNTLRLWPMNGKGVSPAIGSHQQGITAVAFSPDQDFIAAAQWDGALIRIWRPGDSIPFQRVRASANTGVRLSSDGKMFVLNGWSREGNGLKRTRAYQTADAEPAGPEINSGGWIMDAQFAPDSSWLALACLTEQEQAGRSPGAGTLQFWDYRSGELLGEPVPLPAEPRGLSIHPSGQWVGLYDAQAHLIEVNVATRTLRILDTQSFTNKERAFARCSYSPDGTLLVGWGLNLPPRIWNRIHGARRQPDLPSATRVMDVTFRDNVMATMPIESRIDFLSVPELRPAVASIQDNDWLFVGRFSPDGQQFVSGGRGSLARLWNWRSGALECPALQHDDEVFAAAFIPGTDCVTTGSIDQQIRFWNRRTGLPIRPPLPQGCKVMQLTATPDGRTLLRANYGSDHVRLYRAADLFPPATLPPEDALLLAEIDAAAEVHQGGLEPLSAAGWIAKWKQFRAKHPEWHRWFLDERLQGATP